jgi:NADH-quinone oxidoreductase subunit L
MTPQSAPWFILFSPLLAAALILFFGRLSKRLSAGLAIASAVIGCVLSWWLFGQPEPTEPNRFYWMDFTAMLGQGTTFYGFQIPIGVTIDKLSTVMLVVVTTIATLVFIYSIGYMAKEEGYARYFAGLALFLCSMLGIVMADNFIMMFIFWELVGVSSYILIGHYYSRDSAAEACKQAFVVNRIGDFGFMLGILMLWLATGTVVFAEMQDRLGELTGSPLYLGVACVLVFCGTIGKSAQLPLHVWLPNSMEGPTPVSSLLHAATMVAAGVYMLARFFPILVEAPVARDVIAWVGVITCFAAALMATQQSDIKRILAYSTISQLGYMVLAVGVASSAFVPMFHLFTHAFFKCLLFLCAGSVIVGMHHEQSIWKMGALKNKLPVTFVVMCIGGLALSGVPFFSGYYSKDLIILTAWEKSPWLFFIAAAAVGLTAFYTTRLILVTFLGAPRSDEAKKAHESPLVMLVPMILLAIPAWIAGYGWVEKPFFGELPHPEHVPGFAHGAILLFLAIGLAGAFLLYFRGPAKDPVSIPLFANRLYIDDAYAWIVKTVQDGTASATSWFDRWIIDGFCVQFVSGRLAWAFGFTIRFLQIGNIQAYAFFFGAGVVALIYFLITAK